MRKSLLGLVLGMTLALFSFGIGINASAANTIDQKTVDGSASVAVIVEQNVVVSATFDGAPASDDGRIYLFEFKTYEYGIADEQQPVASMNASSNLHFIIPLSSDDSPFRLYNKFAMAVKRNGQWALITNAQYIINPEVLAVDPKPRADRPQKSLQQESVANISLNGKGVPLHIGTQHAVFTNDSMDVVTTDPTCKEADEHPVKRNPVVAYMLNANDDAGIAGLAADMKAYAEHTYVQDFVIGNEVNERCWNYMAWCDWDTYVRKYVQAFRVCYTAIKSVNPNARVYISIDQVWNKNPEGFVDYEYIDGDEFMHKFNEQIRENGNIDWDLSIHPYPNPLYYAKFWDLSGLSGGKTFKAQVDNNQVITFQNMSVITDLLCTPKYLRRDGGVRDVIIGEIGLGSNAGVDHQAAAICASWAAFEANPYVTQYMYLEVDVNGFFPTLNGRALEAFNAMNTPQEEEYMKWAKQHIGIKDWSEVIR